MKQASGAPVSLRQPWAPCATVSEDTQTSRIQTGPSVRLKTDNVPFPFPRLAHEYWLQDQYIFSTE